VGTVTNRKSLPNAKAPAVPEPSRFHLDVYTYQTRQRLAGAIGCPVLHWNACWNSGKFDITPLVRYLTGEWGSTVARIRIVSGRSLLHQLCP